MKKTAALVLIFSMVSAGMYAQSMGTDYQTALGIKVWDGAGITFKTFVAPNKAVEVIGYFWRQGTRITGLYEIHGNIEGAAGLKWYIGPGIHVGFYGDKYYNGDNRAVAGIDGVLGLDYKIRNAPINLSIDWQPSFEFADNRGFAGSWGGLGIRYTF